ncbi:MAG: crossover junction endodeoxyribonuclease RuvC [Candidatus Falkowbacteria bacterium]
MIILGIDPGIADTGYGVIESDKGNVRCLIYGSIKTPAGMPLAERLLLLADELDGIVAKYQPQAAAIEELFFSKNVKTALVVGQARGVAMLSLARQHLFILEYKPSQVKQAVSGFGGADKQQVQRMVQLILKLDELPRPDDAADALAIAICASSDRRLSHLSPVLPGIS